MYSIILPSYNESENLNLIIDKICLLLKQINFEIIIVDDSSDDDTESIINKKKKKFLTILLLLKEPLRNEAWQSQFMTVYLHQKVIL